MTPAHQHRVALTWKGVPSCSSQEELDLRLERLLSRAAHLVSHTTQQLFQRKARILRVDSDVIPKKPLNNAPLEYRMTAVILGPDDVNLALRDYVGLPILQEFFMLVSEYDQGPP